MPQSALRHAGQRGRLGGHQRPGQLVVADLDEGEHPADRVGDLQDGLAGGPRRADGHRHEQPLRTEHGRELPQDGVGALGAGDLEPARDPLGRAGEDAEGGRHAGGAGAGAAAGELAVHGARGRAARARRHHQPGARGGRQQQEAGAAAPSGRDLQRRGEQPREHRLRVVLRGRGGGRDRRHATGTRTVGGVRCAGSAAASRSWALRHSRPIDRNVTARGTFRAL